MTGQVPAGMGEFDELGQGYDTPFDGDAANAGLGRMLTRLPVALAQVWRLSRAASRRATWLLVLAQSAAGVATALALLATARALGALFASGPAPDRVGAALPAVVAVVLATALRAGLETVVAATQARLSPGIRRVAENRLHAAAVGADLGAFDDADWHDALARARDRGIDHAQLALGHAVELLGALVGLLVGVGVVTGLHPVLLPLLALSIAPQGWAALRSARIGFEGMVQRMTLYRRLWLFADLLSAREAAAEVRACTAERPLLAEFRRLAGSVERAEVRVGYAQVRVGVIGRTLSGLALGATYVALGLLVRAEIVPLAVAGTAVLAVRTASGSLATLMVAVDRLYEKSLYITDYHAFLDEASARARPSATRAGPVGFAEIRLRDVYFGYPGSAESALRGVDLVIRQGETVALVGENGSGKTTLALLLAALYHPDKGTVHWDDVDLAEVDPVGIREQVALVMQQPTRWPVTARGNIVLGRADRVDPDGAAMLRAACDAGADGLISRLPHGYDTLLSKKFRAGVDLSGGQWQRIGIARGFYRDARLLIADEPTAALDARAEHAVFANIRRLAAGRTVVLISHRLASVRECDRIVVLRGGEVVQQGSHEELMRSGGDYAELYRLQAAAYGPLGEGG
ncbi:ABC transporter ATP-binding protein [Embleya sp. NPDC059259]|uniref:ABC transporter ATP-binding protein n=1 Tax=unclassified Embleya TaxID=2699296 RepID=UPI0036985E5F